MSSDRSKSTLIRYSALGVIGLLMLCWGFFSAFDLAFNGVVKTGVIVKYERGSGGRKPTPTHFHTVEIAGQLIRVVLDERNELGSEVTLRYIPKRPATQWVNGRTGTPDALGFGGLVFLIIGLVGFWFEKN
jgi:hypothetical protein